MRCVVFKQSAAGAQSQKWTVDVDTVIVGFYGTNGQLLTDDPSQTVTNYTSPTATEVLHELYLKVAAPSGIFSIPLSAGKVIMVQSSGAGTAVLYLEDVVEPQLTG